MAYYQAFHKSFFDYIIPVCDMETLAGGLLWGEGPVWFGDTRCLLFSDIPNNRMLKWDEETRTTAIFRAPSQFANGNTRDRQGRLITCEHGARRVTRTEYDGRITVLADQYRARRLNSPNDVVVSSDGAVWFTDPPYGILTDYEGNKAESEQDGCFVYRLDPITGTIEVVADDFVKPNGLAFSMDEETLYIADSGRSHDPHGPHHVRAFRVHEGRRLSGGEVFAEIDAGIPDGLRVDAASALWVAAADGAHCFGRDGTLRGKILTGEVIANLCFGGAKKNRLFLTGKNHLYSVYLNTRGL